MITLTATTEYKIFTDGDGCEDNDADSIKNEAKCTAAARAVGIDKTATADGGTSGDAPPWCYVTKDGDLMFNEDKNTGECTADNTCICSKCAAGGGSVPVELPEGAFTKIAEIPKDASGVKITVQSPKEGDAPAKGADLDVMLMEEDELPCLPAANKKAADTNECTQNLLLDSNDDPDPNYAKCLAGFYCQNKADDFDTDGSPADEVFSSGANCEANDRLSIKSKQECTDAAKHVSITGFTPGPATDDGQTSGANDDPPYCYVEGGRLMFNAEGVGKNTGSCTADDKCICAVRKLGTELADGVRKYTFTKELKGMSIYFSGDDAEVPVTETVELRAPNDKTTEKLSLWVYAFPHGNVRRCTAAECRASSPWTADGTVAEDTVSGHTAGTCPKADEICPKAVFTGTVTYSYDCVELVSSGD